MRRLFMLPLVALALATMLGGCVVEPAGYGYYHEHGRYYGGGWGGYHHDHDRW
jgi:hypothetical protein